MTTYPEHPDQKDKQLQDRERIINMLDVKEAALRPGEYPDSTWLEISKLIASRGTSFLDPLQGHRWNEKRKKLNLTHLDPWTEPAEGQAGPCFSVATVVSFGEQGVSDTEIGAIGQALQKHIQNCENCSLDLREWLLLLELQKNRQEFRSCSNDLRDWLKFEPDEPNIHDHIKHDNHPCRLASGNASIFFTEKNGEHFYPFTITLDSPLMDGKMTGQLIGKGDQVRFVLNPMEFKSYLGIQWHTLDLRLVQGSNANIYIPINPENQTVEVFGKPDWSKEFSLFVTMTTVPQKDLPPSSQIISDRFGKFRIERQSDQTETNS